jgi:hypothetical protein
MIAAQAASEITPIQKIAARSESRSVGLLSDAAVASEVEISACGSLAIFGDFLPTAPECGRSRRKDRPPLDPVRGGTSPGRFTLMQIWPLQIVFTAGIMGSPTIPTPFNVGRIAGRPE